MYLIACLQNTYFNYKSINRNLKTSFLEGLIRKPIVASMRQGHQKAERNTDVFYGRSLKRESVSLIKEFLYSKYFPS